MSMNLNVNFDAIGERTLRNTSRLVNQGMWILFVISAALMIVLRRNSTSPSGPFWILGFAVLGFMALIVLRDFARKAESPSHRKQNRQRREDISRKRARGGSNGPANDAQARRRLFGRSRGYLGSLEARLCRTARRLHALHAGRRTGGLRCHPFAPVGAETD